MSANWGDEEYIDPQEPRLSDREASLVGHTGGIVATVVAAFATGVLWQDSTSDSLSLAKYASIWPVIAVVTVLLALGAIFEVWS